MKNLIKIAALAALLGAPAFGEETASIEVAIPTTLEDTAALENARMAILDAATELCEAVDYSGVSAFYKPTLDRKCIAGQCQCEPGTKRVVFPGQSPSSSLKER